MLRSFSKHFNNTVFRGPENEGGSDVVTGTENDSVSVNDGGGDDDSSLPDDGDGGAEGGDPSKPLTVREQLKRSIAEANEDAANQARSKKDSKTGRFSKGQTPTAQVDPATTTTAPAQTSAVPAPDSLSRDAKAEWDKTPPAIQQAFIKREQDAARGVQELKQRYEMIDQAIAPHQDALRQMNATPGEAVNRLFLWFKALAGAPAQSFPELAKSMGYDWNKIIAATSGQQQPAQAGQTVTQAGQTAPEIPEPVRNYVGQLEQRIEQLVQHIGQIDNRFGAVQQDMNATNEAKTRENLSIWAKDKEFYEDVRKDMANFIQSGLIPLKNGQVDLDTAYERAIYYNPEVRAKVLAKQQQANQQVQQTADAATTAQRQGQVAKARRAAVSLPSSNSPGLGNGQIPAKKPGQKMTVRDSLKAAMAELRDQ
jgi:hypothetical protein